MASPAGRWWPSREDWVWEHLEKDRRCYALQEQPNGAIKIGITRDIDRRIAQLQPGNPRELRVLALWRPHRPTRVHTVERAIHRRFDEHRIAGEWFQPAPEILAFVERVTREFGPPPEADALGALVSEGG